LELGRERFLEEVWKWKEQYGNRINQQMVINCDHLMGELTQASSVAF
jgi:valyl-tRNA synthetase